MNKLEVLEAIAKSPNGFEYIKPKDSKKIIEQGLIEAHPTMVDELGNNACRLTDAGKEYMHSLNGTSGEIPATKKEKPVSQTFVIMTKPIPVIKRSAGAGRPSKYPFDALEVGQMFFVPCTEKQPDPSKSLGSVVTSANRRYATESGETKLNRKGESVPKLVYGRKFVVRPDSISDENGDLVHGAGVYREK